MGGGGKEVSAVREGGTRLGLWNARPRRELTEAPSGPLGRAVVAPLILRGRAHAWEFVQARGLLDAKGRIK